MAQGSTVPGVTPIEERGYAHPEVLVSTDWVAEHLKDPKVTAGRVRTRMCSSMRRGTFPGRSRSTGSPISTIRWCATMWVGTGSRRSCGRRESIATPRSSSTATRTTGGPPTLLGAPAVRPAEPPASWTAAGCAGPTKAGRSRPTCRPIPPGTSWWANGTTPPIRAFRDEVLEHVRQRRPLVDVRSPEEYPGRAAAHAGVSQRGRAPRRPHPRRAKHSLGPGDRIPRPTPSGPPASSARCTSRRTGSPATRTPSCIAGSASARPTRWFALTYLLGFEQGAELRRLVDRVGQRGAAADREALIGAIGYPVSVGVGALKAERTPDEYHSELGRKPIGG